MKKTLFLVAALFALFLSSCECMDCTTDLFTINGETMAAIEATPGIAPQTVILLSSSAWHLDTALPDWCHLSATSGQGGRTEIQVWVTPPSAGGRPAPITLTFSSQSGKTVQLTVTFSFVPMVFLPAGSYYMGQTQFSSDPEDLDLLAEENEKPRHLVTVSAFSMSKTEVTNAQYCVFLNAWNAANPTDQITGTNNNHYNTNWDEDNTWFTLHAAYTQIEYLNGAWVPVSKVVEGGTEPVSLGAYPMMMVSWYGAKAFCDFYGYRLPTEAEWEYAARGGVDGMLYSGAASNDAAGLDAVGWYWDNSAADGSSKLSVNWGTHPVGGKSANGFGLYDMTGNVWEWCSSGWTDDYDDLTEDPDNRVFRGGGWDYGAQVCRVSCRGCDAPEYRRNFIGFRACL